MTDITPVQIIAWQNEMYGRKQTESISQRQKQNSELLNLNEELQKQNRQLTELKQK